MKEEKKGKEIRKGGMKKNGVERNLKMKESKRSDIENNGGESDKEKRKWKK